MVSFKLWRIPFKVKHQMGCAEPDLQKNFWENKMLPSCSFPSRTLQAEGYLQYFTVCCGQILHANSIVSLNRIIFSVYTNLKTSFDFISSKCLFPLIYQALKHFLWCNNNNQKKAVSCQVSVFKIQHPFQKSFFRGHSQRFLWQQHMSTHRSGLTLLARAGARRTPSREATTI